MNNYNLRYIAQILIEADTPLNISSGENDALTDSLIMNDANGLPMIQGTSLTGVLRHFFDEMSKKEIVDNVFGWAEKNSDKGEGSRLIISNAHFVGNDGKVVEGLKNINWNDEFYSKFSELPIRQHAKINHRGVADAEGHGKFDNQIVYKGTRFKFEIELIGKKEDEEHWKTLLELLNNESFRIGGGTRKGYGKLKIESLKEKYYDLTDKDDLNAYLNKTASLNDELKAEDKKNNYSNFNNEKWIKYGLTLTPEDFYSFGSGFGDEDVDMIPVLEEIIEWEAGPSFTARKILIPASSIKGAISHRVAFHYNKLTGIFSDKLPEGKNIENFTGENNEAVKTLFGFAKDSNNNDKKMKEGQRGNVIFSDVYLKKIDKKKDFKILNHVAIDRFTAGAIDGALYDEKVINNREEFTLEFLVNKEAFQDENIKNAFEKTLKDITRGMLPLGGSVMRGHGVFTGKIKKNEEENYNEKIN